MMPTKTALHIGISCRQGMDVLPLGNTKICVPDVSVILFVVCCMASQEVREFMLWHFLEPARIGLESVIADIDGEDY